MKITKYLLAISFTLAFVSTVQAENLMSAKPVNLPFSQEAIFSSKHDGLIFNYDLSGVPAKKIICTFSKVYKGWLEFSNNGVIRESSVFGNGDSATLVLTARGQNNNDQYHVDKSGSVKVNAVNFSKGKYAAASCYYAEDKA